MKKRLKALFLLFTLLLSGCGNKKKNEDYGVDNGPTTELVFFVGNGDCLSKISEVTEVPIDKIKENNPVLHDRVLYVGDELRINVAKDIVDAIMKSQDSDGLNGTFSIAEKNNVVMINMLFKAGKGDTLYKISEVTGVSIDDIKTQNSQLMNRVLRDGEVLEILVDETRINKILDSQNSDGLNGVFSLNGDFTIPEKDTTDVLVYYKVGKMDMLAKVAKLFGVSVNDIVKWNNIKNPDLIKVGTILKIRSDISVDEYNQLLSKHNLHGRIFSSEEDAVNYEGELEEESNEILHNFPENCERGIDISHGVGEVDWDKLEAAYKRGEFSYIILRLAENSKSAETKKFSFVLDRNFEVNLKECNNRKIPYGVYVFTRENNVDGMIKQAESSVEYLNGLEERGIYFRPSYPVYVDVLEDKAHTQMQVFYDGDYDTLVDMIYSFCKVIEDAGYFTGIYANRDNYYKVLNGAENASKLDGYSTWLAYYGEKVPRDQVCKIGDNGGVDFSKVDSIQVSSKGKVDGVIATVDVNITNKSLRFRVREHYIDLYGENFYDNNLSSSDDDITSSYYENDGYNFNLSSNNDGLTSFSSGDICNGYQGLEIDIDINTFNTVMSDSNLMNTLIEYGAVYVEKTGKFICIESCLGKTKIKTVTPPVSNLPPYKNGYCRTLMLNKLK